MAPNTKSSSSRGLTRRSLLVGVATGLAGFGLGSVFGYRLAGIKPALPATVATAIVPEVLPSAKEAAGQSGVVYSDETIILPMDSTDVGSISDAQVSIEQFDEPCPTGEATGLTVSAAPDDAFVAVSWNFTSTGDHGPVDLQKTGLLGLWFYLPADTVGRPGVTMVLSPDASLANNRQITWARGRDIDFGWNLLLVDPLGRGPTEPGMQDWVIEGEDPISRPIGYMQLRFFGLSQSPKFHLGGLVHFPDPVATPAVILGYDGIHNSLETHAKPLLDSHDMKAYVSVDAEAIEQNFDDSAGRMHRFYDAGWDLVPCGMYHTNYGQKPELIAEHYDEAVRRYRAEGFDRSLRYFTYPRNGYTLRTDAVLREKGVLMARQTFERSIVQTRNWPGRLVSHGAFDLGEQTLTWAKNVVDHAIRYGTTVEIFVHRLVPGGSGAMPPADALEWYADDYAALLDYIATKREQNGLLVQTPSEWATHRGLA